MTTRQLPVDPNHPLPRPIVLGGVGLMVSTILLAAFAHATGVGASRTPPPVAAESRDLVFQEGSDGGMTVRDAGTGATVAALDDASGGGFIRATMRALVRNRGEHGVASTGAMRVVRATDGEIWLEDPETHQNVELAAFGPHQVAAFAALLPAERSTP